METRDGALWAVLLAVGTGAALGACGRWALSYVFSLVLDAFASVSDVETLSGNRTSGRTDNVFNFFGRRRADDDGWRLAASFGAQRLASVRLVCCHRRGFCGCQTIDGLVF